jgi:hypothetical protein
MVYEDGRKYIGEFKNGMHNGFGTITLLNGLKYEGSWKDNKRHGTGIIKYYNSEGKLDGTWKGEFVEDKRHKGKLIFPDGTEVDATEDTFNAILEELKKRK